MHASLALLSAAILSATGMTDAEVRARVEALLGTIDRPARYMCDALHTSMQHTGTLGTGVTSATNREARRASDW
jgi:hypothetical protein